MTQAKTAKFDPSKIKTVKVVSLPTMSINANATVYVKFETPIGTRVINEGLDNERTFQFAQVINHETGELSNLNVDNGVLWALDAEYEKQSYVGKSFQITGVKTEGKRFLSFKVLEIEV